MRNRIEEIKSKGFNIIQGGESDAGTGYSGIPTPDFGKIKVGAKALGDAVLQLGDLRKANPSLANKDNILRAISSYDLEGMRDISDYFYKTSGIYARMIRYMAFMYRYDWFVTPYIVDDKMKDEKILQEFDGCLSLLDDFGVKETLGNIALKVLRYGCYYGYKVENGNSIQLQELPAKYCRSRFNIGNKPAIEFNMKFFDETFRDAAQKMRMLKMFPDEFSKGYVLYKQNKLQPEYTGDTSGWYLLNPKMTVKFNANGEDYPAFISVIPLILNLDEAQELDRKRMMQQLLKIVVQKMPIDKNGDLIFDVDEAQQLHNNAVQMLQRAIGIDVLTTFADTEVEDMSSAESANSTDALSKVERQIYNEAGMSQMQFNTDGNLALEKSIANDEATMYNLLLQFERFLNELLEPYNTKPKKVKYKVQLLTTTIYNYKELSKQYKEQVQLGYSRMLPQLALGQSQSSILANAYFENHVLDLNSLFVPPVSSNTISAEAQKAAAANSNEKNGQVGRAEKPDDEKSEKTIQNKESMS